MEKLLEIWEVIKAFFIKVWGYVVIGYEHVAAWFCGLDNAFLQKIFYALSILILVVGLFKLLKNKKKVKSNAEKIVEVVETPTAPAEEVVKKVKKAKGGFKKFIKKVVNFFKTIWANKNSILAIIVSFVSICIADYVAIENILPMLPFLKDNDWLCCVVGIVAAILCLILDVYGIVNKYGWEGIEEFAERIAARKEVAEESLTKEQRAEYKEKLAVATAGLEEVQARLDAAEAYYTKLKEQVEEGAATVLQNQELSSKAAEIEQLRSQVSGFLATVTETKAILKK